MAASVRVAALLGILNDFAPFSLAADWDNVGLLVGSRSRMAKRIMLAVDLTDPVAREALAKRFDMLIVYHPPIFKGLRSITPAAEGPTTLLPELLAAGVQIIALHTALDAAVGGTNDVLLDALAPDARWPIEPILSESRLCKLVVFVPPAEVEKLRSVLAAAGAGEIGHYTECSFELVGRGTFRGDASTNPSVGSSGVLETVDEVRLEMVVPRYAVNTIVRELYEHHSYEEPAFDLYPLLTVPGRAAAGMGRVGHFRKSVRGETILARLRKLVDLSAATIVGELRRSFGFVAAAAGSFGIKHFVDPAQLVLTGELKHHDALELQRRGVTAVCLGHYASERPVLDVLAAKLRRRLRGIRVAISRADRSPFVPLS